RRLLESSVTTGKPPGSRSSSSGPARVLAREPSLARRGEAPETRNGPQTCGASSPGKGGSFAAMSSIARTAATGGALDPDFLAWQTSLPVDRRLLEVDVAGSVAHVEGLVAGGLVTREEGDTLQAALRS